MNPFKTLPQIRGYSSLKGERPQSLDDRLLPGRTTAIHPWFITGFTDGEGCFHISITKNNKINVGWKVQLFFVMTLSKKDIFIF